VIAVVTVLLALPLGYLVRSWTVANVTYALAYLWAFVFQGVYLLLDAMGGGRGAFTPGEFPGSYGLVTAGILGAGLALVAAGHRLGRRRRAGCAVSAGRLEARAPA
jgi:hypothetical protein